MVYIMGNIEKEVYVLMTTSEKFSSPLLGVYATKEEAKENYKEVQEEYGLEDFELVIERTVYTFRFKEGV